MSIIATHGLPKVLSLRVLLPLVLSSAFLAFSYQHHQTYANRNPKLKPDPQVATNFVKWWLANALDFSPRTAAKNHREAALWIEEHARSSFSETFWSQSKGVGRNIFFIPCHFWPPVENQDNSIVIGVTGDFIAQSDPKLSSYTTKLNLILQKTSYGYRISGWNQPYCVDNSEAIKFRMSPSYERSISDSEANSIPKTNMIAIDYFFKGLIQEKRSNIKEAIVEYSNAIKANPNFTLALLSRGQMHNYMGDKQKAIRDYSEAIRLNPESPEPYFYRALMRRNLNDIKGAIEDNNRGLALRPRQPYAHINRAMDRFSLGDVSGALEDSNEAINIDPSAVAYANRGLIRGWIGNLKGAIDDSNLAIMLDAHLAVAYDSRGNARKYLKDRTGSQADYQKAQRLKKEYPQ